jgi:DNA-binding NarL/FixJ family response regulator
MDSGFPRRVAIVDDNAQIRAVLRELVHTETDARVVAEADDGDHAAAAVAEGRAELVIVDYRMARVDGIEATRRILARCPTVKVVAYTSTADISVADGFLEAGAMRHFDKTDIDGLVACLRELC